jgi:hypothetical protein
MRTRPARILLLFLAAALVPGQASDTPQSGEKLSPAYDVYIGFVAKDTCLPVAGCGHFSKFSFDTVFKNVRFGFNPKGFTIRSGNTQRLAYWCLISDLSQHLAKPYQPVMIVEGQGTIGDHELCPTWSPDDKHVYRVTGTHFEKTFKAFITLQAVKLTSETDNSGLPLVPLVPPKPRLRFEAVLNTVPSPVTWVCEAWAGERSLTAFHYELELPDGLMSGKDIDLVVPFKYSPILKPGGLRISFVPVAKK